MSQAVSNLNSNDNQPKSRLIRWGVRKRLNNINQIIQNTELNQLNLNSSGMDINLIKFSQKHITNFKFDAESPSIPAITIANISSVYPAIKGGFAFALIDSKIHLVQFLGLYYHSTT